MSRESDSSPESQPEADYETLKREFSSLLLAPESPVANEAAFKRDRESYFELLEQRRQFQKKIELLRSAKDDVSPSEKAAREAESRLQVERQELLKLAETLGETAFAGLQCGDIADDPRFAARKELQAQIETLKRQRSSLLSGDVSGMLEQASLKAQQLKLAGQQKVQELKIASINRELGKDILSAKAEEAVRCSSTEQVLDTIAQQRQRVSAAKNELRESETNLANAKKRAADQLGATAIPDSASLGSDLKQQQSQLRSVETRVEDLEETVVNKALGYEWLRDNSALNEPLSRLAELRNEATPRKLSVWPLAAVVIAGHLFAQFGTEPLNLSAVGVLLLYVATGVGGLGLLAYYKPEMAARELRYKSVLLLFAFSIISVVSLLALQSLADYALVNWSEAPSWSRNRFGLLVDLPRRLLLTIGYSYRVTFGLEEVTSYSALFRHHLLSVGLCEELLKLAPALIAFSAFSGPWDSRTKEFNSKLVYLAMIGGLAFGLGEAVHYHFNVYAPSQEKWGIYATRFLACVAGHAALAGISGWILAHVTGGWIRKAFTTVAHGWGPVGGCVLIAATTFPSNLLHTSYNLSQSPLWQLAWDVATLVLFAWVIRCSSIPQLVPYQIKRLWKRGVNTSEVTGVGTRVQAFAAGSLGFATDSRSESLQEDADSDTSTDRAALGQPEIWNPNAAGFWSLLLSPIFGAWLHAKNWTNLNKPEKSRKSFYWVYGSIAALIVTFWLPLAVSNLAYAVLLVAWWMRSGHEQYTYVKEHCPVYRRKRWGTPLSVAGLAAFGVVLLSAAVQVDSMSSHEAEKLEGQWSEEFVADQDQLAMYSAGKNFQLSQMSMKGVVVYSKDRKSRHEFEWLRSGRWTNGSRFRYVLQVTLVGQWSFDGETLTEYVEKVNLIPSNNATKSSVEQSPEGLTDLKNLYTDTPFSYAVIFVGSDELELVDQDTGIVKKIRRVRGE